MRQLTFGHRRVCGKISRRLRVDQKPKVRAKQGPSKVNIDHHKRLQDCARKPVRNRETRRESLYWKRTKLVEKKWKEGWLMQFAFENGRWKVLALCCVGWGERVDARGGVEGRKVRSATLGSYFDGRTKDPRTRDGIGVSQRYIHPFAHDGKFHSSFQLPSN